MSKDCDKITLLDEPLGGDGEDSLIDRPDRAIARVALEPWVLDEEPDPRFRALEPASGSQTLVRTAPSETGASGPEDGVGHELAPSSATALQNAASFSRGLIDTYFRQMGDAAWLSREEEIALAKRIEASQQAVLASLCGVPMLVERIAGWGREVAEGRLRLADLVKLSSTGAEPDAPDVAHDREPVAAGSEDGNAEAHADGEVAQASVMTTRLQMIIALAKEIGSLSQKRLATVGRGRDLSKSSRTRLHELISRLADELTTLRLLPDRVSELIEALEREQRLLDGIEQQPAEISHRAGLPVPISGTPSPRWARPGGRSKRRASRW